MRDRVKLPLMVRLASVQKVRKAAAEAALMSARAAETQARTAEEEAMSQTEAARAEWGEHLAGTAFSPEFSRALAALVIESESAAADASQRRERTAEIAGRRQDEWQTAEARSRSGEISLHRLRRRVRRKAEEDRLAETADRITFDWSRR
jgi:Flp pilus assembly protein TadG